MIESPAKASQIIARARSLADLPFSAFISHADELDSLNEAWKDVYSKFTDSDDDYYVTDTTLTLSSTYAVSGHQGEYLIPLPTDFFKLRYLDYQAGSLWEPVKKFTMAMKNYLTGEPVYRIKGSYLWVLWNGNTTGTSTLRLGYYPPPASVTAPANPIQYATGVSLANFASIGDVAFATLNAVAPNQPKNFGIYVYASNTIYAGSYENNTVGSPMALQSAAVAKTNVVYYKGYLYWLQAADIYRAATDLISAGGAGVNLTATANVTAFAIYNDTIYFSPGATIKTCNLDGTGVSGSLVAAAGSSFGVIGAFVYYVDSSNNLKLISPSTTILALTCAQVCSDGTYLYVRNTSNQLQRLTMTSAGTAVSATDTLLSDVAKIGYVASGYVPLKTKEAATFIAQDKAVDTTFSFPVNFVPELLAYQMAIDFCAKKKAPNDELAARASAIFERFMSVIKRDEYQVNRVQNAYDFSSTWWPR